MYLEFKKKFDALNRKAEKKAVSRSLPHLFAPGLYPQGRRRAGGVPQIPSGICPSRCRISTPRPPQNPPVCTIRGWIRIPCSPCTSPKSPLEKKMQRALMQYRKKSNYAHRAGSARAGGQGGPHRPGEHCLIPYTAEEQAARRAAGQHAPKAGKQGKPSRIPQTVGEKIRGARQKKG